MCIWNCYLQFKLEAEHRHENTYECVYKRYEYCVGISWLVTLLFAAGDVLPVDAFQILQRVTQTPPRSA